MWWISCCWSLEDDDKTSTLTEECFTPGKAPLGVSFLPALSEPLAISQVPTDPLELVRLPSLPLERSRSEEVRQEQGDFTEEDFCEAENMMLPLPRRCLSSELGGIARSLRASRSAAIHPFDDISDTSSPSLKLRQLRRIPHIPAELDRVGAFSPDSQAVGYSSWFALLSKSIGSEVSGNSPAWFIGSQATSRQIEGA